MIRCEVACTRTCESTSTSRHFKRWPRSPAASTSVPRTTESLAAVYEEIDQLERTEIEVERLHPVRRAVRDNRWRQGLLALLLEAGLAQTVLRRLP